MRKEGQACWTRLHVFRALQAPGAPPRWRCDLAQTSITTKNQNPYSPLQRVEPQKVDPSTLPTSPPWAENRCGGEHPKTDRPATITALTHIRILDIAQIHIIPVISERQ